MEAGHSAARAPGKCIASIVNRHVDGVSDSPEGHAQGQCISVSTGHASYIAKGADDVSLLLSIFCTMVRERMGKAGGFKCKYPYPYEGLWNSQISQVVLVILVIEAYLTY